MNRRSSKRVLSIGVGLLGAVSLLVQAADKPGPFAGPDVKLDYLLSTWKGRTLDELKSVWGRHSRVIKRGRNDAYVYEQTSKVRTGASIFTGQVKVDTGAVTCAAFFEINDADEIIWTARNGGGKPCWNMFKKKKPPK